MDESVSGGATVWALLLTLREADLSRERVLSAAWTEWDASHYLAPLGTPQPEFGTVERVQIDVAALRQR